MKLAPPNLPPQVNVLQTWVSLATNILNALVTSGTTAQRPTKFLWTGRPFWDSTLGIPIWYNGAVWVNATGAPV